MVEGAIADRLRANISDKKKKWDKQAQEHKKWVKDAEDAVKAAKDRAAALNSMDEEGVSDEKSIIKGSIIIASPIGISP